MTPRLQTLLACALGLACLGPAAPAMANPEQRSLMQHDSRLLKSGPEVRAATLDEMRALGVDTVKILMSWRDIAPAGASRPGGFRGDDPADYGHDPWAAYDAAIAGAQARGLEVLLTVTGPAPDWATAGPSEPVGVNRPDAAEFERFVRAVGTRYSGAYVDPLTTRSSEPPPFPPLPGQNASSAARRAPLPRVSLWSIWNEPNLPRFLLPQRASDRAATPASPSRYRLLLRAAHGALVATGHEADTILVGELLPVGRSSRHPRSSLRPLEFLRELACVDSRFRAYRGRAARIRGCEGFTPLPGNGFGYHPYTTAGGPRSRPPHRDDATIGTLSRVITTLDRLARRGRIALRDMPLFITEFAFQTNPPDPFQTPIGRVPGYMGESEWLAFRNPRVASYAQYLLVDDGPRGTGFSRYAGWQSGLRFSDGRPKPGVYDAYRTPLFVRRLSRSKVQVFGGLRTASGGEQVTVESRRRGGGWRALPGGSVTLGPRGYFAKSFRVRSADRRQYRFVFAGSSSRSARAARR